MREAGNVHERPISTSNVSDELLRLAVQVGGIGIYDTDFEQGRTQLSPELCTILGLPVGTELPNTEASEFFDERDRAAVKASLEAASDSADEGKWSGVHRLVRADGAVRWVSIHGRRYYRHTAGGRQVVRSIGTVIDITHLKETEASLRESEARFQIATSGAALGVFEQDVKADRTVWVNDRMYEIFGRTPADGDFSRQQFLEDYLHPDDVDALQEARKHALQTGDILHVVCRIRRKDGLERWLQIDGRFELADTGEPLRFFGVVANITARKMLEQEAEELSERLITLQEDERQRITLDLHDSTAQHLVAASLNLMSLSAKVRMESDQLELLDEVEASLKEALKELRMFSYVMHPLGLHSDGLRSTLFQYIGGYANRSGLSVKLRSSPKVDELPLRMQRSLFRIVQEAMANARRHAQASQVAVDLRWIAGRLHVLVTDNGRGAGGQEGPPFRQGVGIFGIRARARQFGGDLRIRTGPEGTRVHVVTLVDTGRRRKTAEQARTKMQPARI